MNDEFNVENNNYTSEENDLNNININNQNSNNKNDKWKDTLILVLVIIVFILTALSLYFVLDKKNDLSNNKENNQQENEKGNLEEGKDENNFEKNEFDEKQLLMKNVEILTNIGKNGYKLNQNHIEEGTIGDIYSNRFIENENINEEDKLLGLLFTYYNYKESDFAENISAYEIERKYKELFNSDVTFKLAPDDIEYKDFAKYSLYNRSGHTCSYTSKNTFYCRPTNSSFLNDEVLTYIYDYVKENNNYYVYVSVGRHISGLYEESKYYLDYNKKNEYILEDGEKFEIGQNNYQKFSSYKYTFKLNDDKKSYRFISLESLK